MVGMVLHVGAGADQDLPRAADLPGTDLKGAVTERACDLGDGEACRGVDWWHYFGERAAPRTSRSPPHTSSRVRQPPASTWHPCRIGRSSALRKTRRRRANSKSAPACDLNDPMGCKLCEESQRAGPRASVARLFRLGVTMLLQQTAQLVVGETEGFGRPALMALGTGQSGVDQAQLVEAHGFRKTARNRP